MQVHDKTGIDVYGTVGAEIDELDRPVDPDKPDRPADPGEPEGITNPEGADRAEGSDPVSSTKSAIWPGASES